MKIINVVGARPNFMKIAPIMEAYGRSHSFDPLLVHTGQHYDAELSDSFFRELGIPEPDINLGVGSGSHAVQTAEIMKSFEPVILEHRPRAVLVVGDVNSTIACGLVAVKLGVALIHVEAGLRSLDRSMPEEINRVLTDAMSDLLFCTEPSGVENLRGEGIAPEKVFLVGNVMIDTLLRHRERAAQSKILERIGVGEGEYVVVTLHRPSNVDRDEDLEHIVEVMDMIQRQRAVIFPVHPRTRRRLENSKLGARIAALKGLQLIEPLGYIDFLRLLSKAEAVLTDSGGIQEETTVLGVPCLTLRENTERPITVTMGSNEVVGTDPERVLEAYRCVTEGKWKRPQVPPLWDGKAAERIVAIMTERL